MAAPGRPPAVPVTRYAWVMARAEEGLSYRRISQRYYAAFGEEVNYSTFKRLMDKLEKHSYYGERAKLINQKRAKYGNTCPANGPSENIQRAREGVSFIFTEDAAYEEHAWGDHGGNYRGTNSVDANPPGDG